MLKTDERRQKVSDAWNSGDYNALKSFNDSAAERLTPRKKRLAELCKILELDELDAFGTNRGRLTIEDLNTLIIELRQQLGVEEVFIVQPGEEDGKENRKQTV